MTAISDSVSREPWVAKAGLMRIMHALNRHGAERYHSTSGAMA